MMHQIYRLEQTALDLTWTTISTNWVYLTCTVHFILWSKH